MKFSRFRGQDIWKMAVKLGVVIIALVVVVGVGLYFGGKYAAPKVTSFVEGVKENLAQREKEKEEEEKLAAMQEDSSSGVEDSERSEEDGSGGDGADSGSGGMYHQYRGNQYRDSEPQRVPGAAGGL